MVDVESVVASALTAALKLETPVNVDTPETVIVSVLTLTVSPIPDNEDPSPLKLVAVTTPVY